MSDFDKDDDALLGSDLLPTQRISVALAVVLALFLGPIGLLYSSIGYAAGMFFFMVAAFMFAGYLYETATTALLHMLFSLTLYTLMGSTIISAVLAAFAATKRNRKVEEVRTRFSLD